MPVIDLWELLKTGRSGGLELGRDTPEEAMAVLGETSTYLRGVGGAFDGIGYPGAELWFHHKNKRLQTVKVVHPAIKRTRRGLGLGRMPKQMRLGRCAVTLADVDQSLLPRLPQAIEATKHLGLAAMGRSAFNEIDLQKEEEGRHFHLAYLAYLALVDEGDEPDPDYFLWGAYVADYRVGIEPEPAEKVE